MQVRQPILVLLCYCEVTKGHAGVFPETLEIPRELVSHFARSYTELIVRIERVIIQTLLGKGLACDREVASVPIWIVRERYKPRP